MAKKIAFTSEFNGKEYTLEFNRNIVIALEDRGLDINDISTKLVKNTTMLIRGAFDMHHKETKEKTRDAVYLALSHKGEFLKALVDCYNETAASLFGVNEEDSEGNPNWEVVE